jgi:rRNA maturation protein Nop10
MALDHYHSEIKCKSCGNNLQKVGPFAQFKKEGESSHKGLSVVHLYCLTEDCPENGKDMEIKT